MLSDLADSPKQIITGLAMQATVATVTELVVLSSAVSFMTELKLIYKVDCHYLVRSHYFVLIVFVYFMKLQMKFRDSASFHGFRFTSAIPQLPRLFCDHRKSPALQCKATTVVCVCMWH